MAGKHTNHVLISFKNTYFTNINMICINPTIPQMNCVCVDMVDILKEENIGIHFIMTFLFGIYRCMVATPKNYKIAFVVNVL